jgi:CBS domain-containing protein
MRAHQIMTHSVAAVAPDATILEAANIMLRQHVSGLPVVDAAGQLVGIVSEGDFIRRSEIGTQRKRGRWLKFLLGAGTAATDYVHEYGRKISDVMTSEPLTVTEDATLEEIVTLMETNGIKRLPPRTRQPTTTTFAAASSPRSRRTTGARSASTSSCATASSISAA